MIDFTFEIFVSGGTDYVIATTSLISGDRLINYLTQKLEAVILNPFWHSEQCFWN